MAFLDFKGVLEKTGKGSKLIEYAIIFKILNFAKEYICDSLIQEIAEKLKTESFKNGVLTISTSSSSAASELKLHEKALIDFIEKNTKQKIIKKIRILLL